MRRIRSLCISGQKQSANTSTSYTLTTPRPMVNPYHVIDRVEQAEYAIRLGLTLNPRTSFIGGLTP